MKMKKGREGVLPSRPFVLSFLPVPRDSFQLADDDLSATLILVIALISAIRACS